MLICEALPLFITITS